MTICAVCATRLDGTNGLCPHHASGSDDGWALTNRIMCDLLHRGIMFSRLPEADRDRLWDEAPPETATADVTTEDAATPAEAAAR